MTTIIDVAERAGVSPKTVSRVLNDHESVSARTRGRVHAAMQDLDYRALGATRAARGPFPSVGALMGDPSAGYHTRIHHALLLACLETGRHMSVDLFEGPTPGWQDRVSGFVREGGIREMILLPPECDFGPMKTLLRELGVRCVLISPTTPDPEFPAIAMDDRGAAREVVEHLFALGHTRIGHIAGHPDHAASTHRRNGFFEAYAARGLPRPPPELVVEGDFTFKTGLEAARRLLDLPEPPTAIFASNDDAAAATCMEIQRRGLRIPDDISVVGFDDAPIAGVIWPSLTTIRQPYEQMALRALQTFAAWDANAGVGATNLPFLAQHSLVARESAGHAPRGP